MNLKSASVGPWLMRIAVVIGLFSVIIILSQPRLNTQGALATADVQLVTSVTAAPAATPPLDEPITRENEIVLLGATSNNPRAFDPTISGGHDFLFSGLVTFDAQLKVVPDLADSWTISPDGSVYTFHIRSNARFHNGRPVTAQDVVDSWEHAADPATASDIVLTYLGDIVGLADKRAGKAQSISGLKVLDSQHLQVIIDAPKPYFLMKLTYGAADVIDKSNIESGPKWYLTPNGTGPYKLIRSTSTEIVYERNDDFYLTPPPIRYIVEKPYAGVGINLYEEGKIDIAGISAFNVARFLDPGEPLHKDLYQAVSMCTSYVLFDTTQPPFDDPKVRQAFALATDRQKFIALGLSGAAIPSEGLYPPALPGFNPALQGLDYNPDLARQRLAESKYGSVANLPSIIFTRSGFSSYVPLSTNVLIDMWQKTLGISIQVESIEPDKFSDQIDSGHHGQLLLYGWCADYPDPENFADALFHSGVQQNIGHYSNPAVDKLLEQGRIERDITRRIQRYQQAEQLIVNDAPAIFLDHGLSYVLVKPYIKGYTLNSDYPLYRFLSLDPSQFPQ